MLLLIICLLVASNVHGLKLQGQCEKNLTKYQEYNDITRLFQQLQGTFYEIAKLPNDYEKGDCPSFTFSPFGNLTYGEFNITHQETVDKKVVRREGKISGITEYGYAVTLTDGLSFPIYFMLTDYQNYGILYSCINENNTTKSVMAWQLTKKGTLTNEEKENIAAVINATSDLKSSWKSMSHTKQACNASVTVVSSITLLIFGLFATKKVT